MSDSFFHQYFLKIILFFIYSFILAVLGLRCCLGFSLVVAVGGYTLIVVHGLLIAEASLVVEHQL